MKRDRAVLIVRDELTWAMSDIKEEERAGLRVGQILLMTPKDSPTTRWQIKSIDDEFLVIMTPDDEYE